SRKTISILIVPESKAEPVSLRINPAVFKTVLIILCLSILLMAAFIVNYSTISWNILRVNKMKAQIANMNKMQDSLIMIKAEIARIHEYEQKIAQITGSISQKKDENLSKAIAEKENIFSSEIFTHREMEKFINNIKLKRNQDFLRIKDYKDKRLSMLNALPNILPVDGWISRGFDGNAEISRRKHLGIDIAASMKTPIKATAPGIVTFAGWEKDLGNLVIIDNGHEFITRYGHCSRILVKNGDIVKRGTVVGLIGNTGRSSAPHLHYEVIHRGECVDPLKFIVR
ncbi:MAG: M23 family metallopeptidase, partial [bacterium]